MQEILNSLSNFIACPDKFKIIDSIEILNNHSIQAIKDWLDIQNYKIIGISKNTIDTEILQNPSYETDRYLILQSVDTNEYACARVSDFSYMCKLIEWCQLSFAEINKEFLPRFVKS